jgi:hypothetical protein
MKSTGKLAVTNTLQKKSNLGSLKEIWFQVNSNWMKIAAMVIKVPNLSRLNKNNLKKNSKTASKRLNSTDRCVSKDTRNNLMKRRKDSNSSFKNAKIY